MCVCLCASTPTGNSQDTSGVSKTNPTLDSYLEITRLIPQDGPPLQMPVTSPGYLPVLLTTDYKSEAPTTPPWFDCFRMAHELRENLFAHQWLQRVLKDMNQPLDEIHSMIWEGVLHSHISSCSLAQGSPNLSCGFLEASLDTMITLLAISDHFAPAAPTDWQVILKFEPLISWLVFPGVLMPTLGWDPRVTFPKCFEELEETKYHPTWVL